MSALPKISIVTPSYNRVWAISSCIESIRRQHYPDYEHIIIDGGSTDGTLELIQAAAAQDPRIRYVSGPDRGMYDAVNKGMAQVRGEIVTYLNTDDFYFPGALHTVARSFQSSPEVDLVYGHWMSWHPETGFVEPMPVLRYNAADMATFACLPQPAVFFRRKLVESITPFDLSFKLLADNAFFARVIVQGAQACRVDCYLSMQTVHSGNLLAGNSEAVKQAIEEGNRYRRSLQRSVGHQPVRLGLARSKARLLPLLWRFALIVQLLRLRLAGGRKTGQVPAQMAGSGIWSLKHLIGYVTSGAGRHRHPFLVVAQQRMSELMGFRVPDPSRPHEPA